MKTYALLLLAALLYAQGFPNHLGFIFPLGPIFGTALLLVQLFKAKNAKQRVLYYLYYNTVINIHSFAWITGTLEEFGKLPFILAACMNSLYALVFNPHIWVVIFILSLLPEKKYKYFFQTGLFSLIAAGLMTLLEYYTPQQFPVMIGQPWIDYPYHIGLAKVFGLVGFSFFSYLIVFDLIRGVRYRKISWVNFSLVSAFVVGNILYSAPSDPEQKIQQTPAYHVRLVQANISNFLKIDSEQGGFHSVEAVLKKYLDLSMAPSPNQLDLIVWPETAYPFPIYTNSKNLLATKVPATFSQIVYEQNSPILFGGYDHFGDNQDNSYYHTEYNAALLINTIGQLEQVYHKHVLIPFGETLPFGFLNKKISQLVPEIAFFKPGDKKVLFETENGLKFMTTICYEKLRPEFLRNYLNALDDKPHLMLNLTNDSWYGDTLEPELHLFLARWRSAELDIPTLRSTNTGISVYINRHGAEVTRLAYNVTGNLDAQISQNDAYISAPTLFQRFGILNLLLVWLVFFLFHIFLLKYRHEKNPDLSSHRP